MGLPVRGRTATAMMVSMIQSNNGFGWFGGWGARERNRAAKCGGGFTLEGRATTTARAEQCCVSHDKLPRLPVSRDNGRQLVRSAWIGRAHRSAGHVQMVATRPDYGLTAGETGCAALVIETRNGRTVLLETAHAPPELAMRAPSGEWPRDRDPAGARLFASAARSFIERLPAGEVWEGAMGHRWGGRSD